MSLLEDKKKITETYFSLINVNNIELFGVLKEHLEKVQQILPIIEFVLERLDVVTMLTTTDRLWDAEIVLRSAQETLIKLIFITSADKDEQQKRLQEFWYDLAEVNLLKQSEQAKKNLKHLTSETHRLAYIPIVLTEERETELRAKWTKAERQKLEQKWSFSEMINSLSKSFHGEPLEIFVTLAHAYRMASHVTHGDETGILIIRERNSRSQEEQEKANFAHYLRLMSDSFSYCGAISMETLTFLNIKQNPFTKAEQELNEIQELIDKYHADVFLDKDYDKFREQNGG